MYWLTNPPSLSAGMRISFRPHHFLCTLGFQGRGYSPEFIANYKAIVESLHRNEETPIEVVAQGDSICRACPHQEQGICEQEEKIQGLDARHSHVLGLHPGDVLSWKQARALLKKKMTLDAFDQACAGCSWKASGICEAALRELQQ
jgi:hypothetical protein